MCLFLKALMKCAPPFRLCEKHLKPIIFLNSIHPKLSKPYASLVAWSIGVRSDEEKLLYKNARLFIAYDDAMEGGRDQEWWFKKCADRWAETAEYWAGNVPHRVSYIMSHEDPLKYPNTYVKWKFWMSVFKTKEFIIKNKWWLVAVTLLIASHLIQGATE